jgi:hypothetical protein
MKLAVANTEPRPRYACTETHVLWAFDLVCTRCGAAVTAQHYDVSDSKVTLDCSRCFTRLIAIAPR